MNHMMVTITRSGMEEIFCFHIAGRWRVYMCVELIICKSYRFMYSGVLDAGRSEPDRSEPYVRFRHLKGHIYGWWCAPCSCGGWGGRQFLYECAGGRCGSVWMWVFAGWFLRASVCVFGVGGCLLQYNTPNRRLRAQRPRAGLLWARPDGPPPATNTYVFLDSCNLSHSKRALKKSQRPG